MDPVATYPKIRPTGEWRTVIATTQDSLTDLPDISNFAPNPDGVYDHARVYFKIDFGGDTGAHIDLRFATGVDVTEHGEAAPNHQAKGWILVPKLVFGDADTGTPPSATIQIGSSEAKQEHMIPNIGEGDFAVDVPVFGQDLWVSIGGAVAYTPSYGLTVRSRIVWFNKN